MGLDSRLAEGELLGDLGVAQAAGQKPEHVEFPGGEMGQFATYQRGGRALEGEAFQEPARGGGRAGRHQSDHPDGCGVVFG